MGKEQKKRGWVGFIVLGLASSILAIASFYNAFRSALIGESTALPLCIGVGFVMLGIMFFAMRDKEDKQIFIAFLFFSIIFFSIAIGIGSKLYFDGLEAEYAKEQYLEYHEAIVIADARYYRLAENAYENYTADTVMLPMFHNLTTIHPFLLEQLPHLREYMDVLTDNVTVENYNCAYDQFVLCATMDRDYSENYTTYFARYDELYFDLDFVHYDSVSFPKLDKEHYLVAYRGDYDDEDGVYLRWYSDELHYFELQLEYISGILMEE